MQHQRSFAGVRERPMLVPQATPRSVFGCLMAKAVGALAQTKLLASPASKAAIGGAPSDAAVQRHIKWLPVIPRSAMATQPQSSSCCNADKNPRNRLANFAGSGNHSLSSWGNVTNCHLEYRRALGWSAKTRSYTSFIRHPQLLHLQQQKHVERVQQPGWLHCVSSRARSQRGMPPQCASFGPGS